MSPINSRKSQNQSEWFYTAVGIVLGILIINDLCHIFTGNGLWFHLSKL